MTVRPRAGRAIHSRGATRTGVAGNVVTHRVGEHRPLTSSMNAAGFEPDLKAWDAFNPQDVAARLAGVDVPWYVSGGWAFDLLLGGRRRDHLDLEIAVPRESFDAIAPSFPELEFFTVGGGKAWPLPAYRDLFDAHHQTWGRDPANGRWRIDIKREPHQGQTWLCRLDPRIQMPYRSLIHHSSEGIPFGAPEAILLFKAEWNRAKDDDDFNAVLPLLSKESRRWLGEGLEMIHPGHHWLAALNDR